MTSAREGHQDSIRGGTGRPLEGFSVLVVDHYEPLRWMKVHLLRGRGAAVVEAASGFEALAALDADRVDVALVACGLSDMPANEVRERIREKCGPAPIPVIYVSASGADLPRGDAEGILVEPLDADELAITVLLVHGVAVLSRGPEGKQGSIN